MVHLEDFPRLEVVQRAGHNVPRADAVVFFPRRRDGFGKNLKQRPVLDGTYGKISFRPVKSETGRLAAGHYKGGHFAGRY